MHRNKLLLLLVLAVVLRLSPSPAFATGANLSIQTHYSPALGKNKDYWIYVPSDPLPGERFKVLFILHGYSENYYSFIYGTDIEFIGDQYRTIMVFPDGDYRSWWLNDTDEPRYQYESYLTDLVRHIDETYPTYARREGRAIMGFSMGGHGALINAIKHPDIFKSASSFAGILRITVHPWDWEIAGRLGSYAENSETWSMNCVYDQCHRLAGADVDIMMDAGWSDWTGAFNEGQITHLRMDAAGVPNTWTEVSGNHDYWYVNSRVATHMKFHNDNMDRALNPFYDMSAFVIY